MAVLATRLYPMGAESTILAARWGKQNQQNLMPIFRCSLIQPILDSGITNSDVDHQPCRAERETKVAENIQCYLPFPLAGKGN